MKKIILIFIIHCSLLITHCISQSITWQRLYDKTNYDICEDICAADNGNFYVAGSVYQTAFVMKMNPYGDTIWTRIISVGLARAVTSSGDGGCVFTGENGSSSYSAKLNSNGN